MDLAKTLFAPPPTPPIDLAKALFALRAPTRSERAGNIGSLLGGLSLQDVNPYRRRYPDWGTLLATGGTQFLPVAPPIEPPELEVHVFDVEHGGCAAIVLPSGQLMLIDAGHNTATGWRPSTWVANRNQVIANFTITNFDHDHLSDLPNVRRVCRIETVTANWSLSAAWLRRVKTQGMGAAVESGAQMMDAARLLPPRPLNTGGATVAQFWHPVGLFQDTNSLSVVTFIQYRGVRIVFPGDLSCEAWRWFLANPSFRQLLATTNILVASHHGREDGYCLEVFKVCRPDVVIISDKSVVHDTQQAHDYGGDARGISRTHPDGRIETRSCLTTRCDGKITIKTAGTGYRVSVS